LAEYNAVLRTLVNSNLLVIPTNQCFHKWFHSSHVFHTKNDDNNSKQTNNRNNKRKNEKNSSFNNNNDMDDDNKDENEEPKSSLLAKAAIWMLSGYGI